MKKLPWILAGIGVGAAIAYVVMNEPRPQAAGGWDSVENAAGDAWKFGTKAKVSGLGARARGQVKEGVGRALGDDDLANEGVGDQAVGAAKGAAGELAHAVGQTIHDLNR